MKMLRLTPPPGREPTFQRESNTSRDGTGRTLISASPSLDRSVSSRPRPGKSRYRYRVGMDECDRDSASEGIIQWVINLARPERHIQLGYITPGSGLSPTIAVNGGTTISVNAGWMHVAWSSTNTSAESIN